MKHIVKLGSKQFIHLDSYSETNVKKAIDMITYLLMFSLVSGMAFVVTGAMLGTDLTKPSIQWPHLRNTSSTLR